MSKEEKCVYTVTMDTSLMVGNSPKQKRKVPWQTIGFFAGIFFNLAAFKAVIAMQSSINIVDSVGAISGTVVYFTSILCGFLCTPTLLRIFGPKNVLILSEIGYCVYIIGNFYPVSSVMIAASVCGGIGESTIWASMGSVCVGLAADYSRQTGKSKERYCAALFGQLYAVVNSTMVFGNLVSYTILMITHDNAVVEQVLVNNTSVEHPPHSTFIPGTCGSFDCQNPNATKSNIEHYVPSSRSTVYLLMSIFTAMCVIGIVIHYKGLKPIVDDDDEDTKVQTKEQQDNFQSYLLATRRTLHKTFLHLINPVQLLLLPITFYAGVELSFMMSEYTRAYVSCVIGVEHIGLMVAEFGLAGSISSAIAQKINSSRLKHIALVFTCAVDVTIYCICLLVDFDLTNVWLLHTIAILQGMTNGIIYPVTNKMCTEYFRKDCHDIAFSVWGSTCFAGIMAQFALSTLLCMDVRLYLHIGITTVSAVCYFLADMKFQKQRLTNTTL